MKKWADRLFKWYCHPEYYPDIKGDLEELYERHLETGITNPEIKYVFDVLLLFRISLIRPVLTNSIINKAMIFNYLKISLRTLKRNKVYAWINIFGLAVGLAGFLLINEYIQFEKGYDSFHENADNLYRVSTIEKGGSNGDVKDAMASYSLGEHLQLQIPEITSHTVTKKLDDVTLKNGNVVFKEQNTISADSTFLDHFTYKVISGNKETFFEEPYSIVLTESKAKTYFGNENPIGKTIEVLTPFRINAKVTGVIQDIPQNTHYYFDIMVSDKSLADEDDYKNWSYNNYYVYLHLKEGTDVAYLNEKIAGEPRSVIDADSPDYWEIHPVQDIYLNSDYTFEPQLMGSKNAISILLVISVFILLIAWINYVNLATARAVDRAKEVGLRKVVGAFKTQLVTQFLFESFLINVLGAFVAILLAELALPYFNHLVDKTILSSVWNYPPFLLKIGFFVIAGTFISGFYPAIVLSGFRPISTLKGKFSNSKSGMLLRRGLVIGQFAASLTLIAATFIVYLQVNYMKNKDKGMDSNYVVTISVPGSGAETEEQQKAFQQKFTNFKNELRNFSAISAVGGTSNVPGGGASDINSTTTRMGIVGLTESLQNTTYIQYNDDNFIDAMNMKLISGRDFDRTRKLDSAVVIVNEAFLRRLNIFDYESVVGEQLLIGNPKNDNKMRIIGVVKDFNRTTLKSSVEPTVFLPWYDARHLVVRLEPVNFKEGLDYMENKWMSYFPNQPFSYVFLDERYEQLYDQDQRFGNVFATFSLFAILVATLGLFGLVSFLALQRTKEVGIRKVLGANNTNIVMIFYKDFAVLLGISALIGIPAIYLTMNSWLSNYAFRINFPWYVVAIAFVIVSLFALVTVGYQIYKVAILDPSKTLKYE